MQNTEFKLIESVEMEAECTEEEIEELGLSDKEEDNGKRHKSWILTINNPPDDFKLVNYFTNAMSYLGG